MMNSFENIEWSKETYEKFLSVLQSHRDIKYREFNSSLMNDDSIEYIGVRTPILNDLVKQISKGDYLGFLKYNTHKTYEERTIHGKLLFKIKVDFNTLIRMLDEYIVYVSNWALVDGSIMKFKQIKGNEKACLSHIERWLDSENQWAVRVGLNMLFTNFINAEYIKQVLSYAKNVKHDAYYVKMMNAWLIAECFTKFRDETLLLLKEMSVDSWTQNKAIQKIRESFRVTAADKQMLLEYKKALK